MNSHTTRRPRIGLLAMGKRSFAAIENVDEDGNLVWYSDSIDGAYEWPTSADFTPLAEIPEPRMDEPQETWATVVAGLNYPTSRRVFVYRPNGNWERLHEKGTHPVGLHPWSDLIDPRPTTPTERATGIVGGEDQ